MKGDDAPKPRRMENGSWYWIDKAVIRDFAPKVGVVGIAVYNYLASLANTNQTCFPSQGRIGDVLGYSRTTVNRVIKTLEQHGLISVDKTGRYQQTYRLLDVRCKTKETEVLNRRNQGVKPAHTNNNKTPRYINNSSATASDIHRQSFQICNSFTPAVGTELLAVDIAKSLNDKQNLQTYITLCREYPESLLRRALDEAKQVPDVKIRKSRVALFKYLVRIYAQQSTDNPSH